MSSALERLRRAQKASPKPPSDDIIELAWVQGHWRQIAPGRQVWIPTHDNGRGMPAPPQIPSEVMSMIVPGDKVYAHPQGAAIIVRGTTVTKINANGKRASTSATAAKLAQGHGAWKLTDVGAGNATGAPPTQQPAPAPVAAPAPTTTPPAPASPPSQMNQRQEQLNLLTEITDRFDSIFATSTPHQLSPTAVDQQAKDLFDLADRIETARQAAVTGAFTGTGASARDAAKQLATALRSSMQVHNASPPYDTESGLATYVMGSTGWLDVAPGRVLPRIVDWTSQAKQSSAQAFLSTVRRDGRQRLSTIRVSQLPFDLNLASRSVRSAYVRAEGGQFVQSMPKDDQIEWVKAHLVAAEDLAYADEVKQRLEDKAEKAWNARQARAAANRAAAAPALQQAAQSPGGTPTPPPPVQPGAQPSLPGLSAPDPVVHSASVPLTFQLAPQQRKLAGWSTKYIVHDQFGNEWLFKPEERIRGGVSGEFRTDMEHAAHQIANHLGFQTAESRIVSINGQRGQVQRLFPDLKGDLVGVRTSDLTAAQRQDVVDEHLLDWLLANHDGHEENLLLLKDDSLVGIDKGASFKYHGKDKLEIGFRPGPMQTKPHPHDDLYLSIIGGAVTKSEADELVRTALSRAARIELAGDGPVREALIEAQRSRPTSTYRDTKANNAQELANLVVRRKNNLSSDFEAFFRDLYRQAGYDFDADLVPDRASLRSGQVDGVYSGLSKPFFKSVRRSGATGIPTFFAGTDIEDGHIHFWSEDTQSGDSTTRGQLKLRPAAGTRVLAWLQSNLGASTVKKGPATPQTIDDIPDEATFWPSIEDVAKNFTYHAKTGNYSARRIQQAQDLLTRIVQFEQASIGKSEDQLGGDRALYLSMLDYYKVVLQDLNRARLAGQRPQRVERFSFKPKLLPPANPGSPTTPTLKLEVKTETAHRTAGTYDVDKGRYRQGLGVNDHSGQMYTVTVNDAIKLKIRPESTNVAWGSPRVPLSQQGLVDIELDKEMSEPADFEPVLAALREIGVDLKPAEREDLELLYWRQLHGTFQSRQSDTKYAPVRPAITSGMTQDEEILAYKSAYAKVWGQDVVDSADYRPHLSSARPQDDQLKTGRPYWIRPDITKAQIKKDLANRFPFHGIGQPKSALLIAKSGQMLSPEERIRSTGEIGPNSHAAGDQTTGGANYIFAQLGIAPLAGNHFGRNAKVLFSPDVARRITTWHLPVMGGGAVVSMNQGTIDPSGWTRGARNAIHIKNGVSVLDDVEGIVFPSDADRDEAIQFYKNQGITTVRGLPLSQRFVTVGSNDESMLEQRAWDAYLRSGLVTQVSQQTVVQQRPSTSLAQQLRTAKTPAELQQLLASALKDKRQARSLRNGQQTWNGTKQLTGMNGTVPQSQADKLLNPAGYVMQNRAAGQVYRLPLTGRRSKFQALMPKGQTLDMEAVEEALRDPSYDISTWQPPSTLTVSGKRYLVGGFESFMVQRMRGARQISVTDSTVYTYGLTDQQQRDAGVKV